MPRGTLEFDQTEGDIAKRPKEEVMKVDGTCHCGHVTYTAEIDPGTVSICHCTDCQVLTSSAFRIVVLSLEGTFRLLSGKPQIYVKIADSGTKRAQAFCSECGTQMYSAAAVDNPEVYGLRVGSIRQRAQLRPSRQIWCQSALAWVNDIASLPQSERTTLMPGTRGDKSLPAR
jgi:hypothetical protein